MTDFLAFIRKHGNLKKAWQTIKVNGNRSSSPYVKDDIEKFSTSEDSNIRSISTKIQHGTYEFSPARGIALEKPNKPGSVRPIVIPRAQDRLVQRCILDALISDPTLRAEAFQPTSFGGVPKRSSTELAGVPAAIKAVMDAIISGGTHVIIADIASFFSNIRKSDAALKISKYSSDPKFIELFNRAIKVDLDNHEIIWRHKDAFPYGDIGVGQGVCLSPFLGNLVLSDIDKELNMGDCSCIRYVDDIIIIAPSGRAASARFRKAKKLLQDKGMEFSHEKTSITPIEVSQKFEYLGIEFNNRMIRPSQKSRNSILKRTMDVASLSLQMIKSSQSASEFNTNYSIPRTLSKISGMSRGWANHYRFCNDIETIINVDRKISNSFLSYSKKSIEIAKQKIDEGKQDLAASYLGYSGMTGVDFDPFGWDQ
ncbi:reverse transcriptase domain-containing protein [Croceicoccus estronivorus]|uniref:reverse transcriptase domain-containing protein n=1 Tax=Croceicoccus estronivorus TaxID=1172626 RepID=UPI0009EE2CFA|nr:reverse transcriptase/maturase family protein [Croceicoccus estronivorus]